MNTGLNSATPAANLGSALREFGENLWLKVYFKFILPRITKTQIEGITLDLTSFSPRLRNRIMRGYESAEMKCCSELLHADDRVLELGGGIGFIGLFCQKNLGIRTYTTVEANPETIRILNKNYALNGVRPNVWNLAVAEKEGKISFNIGGDFWGHNVENVSTSEPTVTVQALPFKSLLQKLPTPPTTLIIDIEGAERFIDFREIPEDIKKVIIEIHPVIIGQQAIDEIFEALKARGFRMMRHEGDTLAFTRTL